MTDKHPITPPPDLVQQWNQVAIGTHFHPYGYSEYIATQAARWGANMELDACCKEILCHRGFEHPELFVELLLDKRRPQQPSAKEQALQALDEEKADMSIANYKTIRTVLEQLDD